MPGARDGWELALESFADPGPFLARVRRLGEVTARMHTCSPRTPATRRSAPENRGHAAQRESAEADARDLLDGLEPGGAAEAVRARAADVLERLRALHRAGAGGQAIRQHGDYHLGQVLWADGDWLVLDFEGEPARPVAERRRKSSPLRDVAGALRSFAYAAETARGQGRSPATGSATPARRSSPATTGRSIESLLPEPGVARDSLLAACELEKALYELRYELNNRPGWVHVPAAGILRLLDEAPLLNWGPAPDLSVLGSSSGVSTAFSSGRWRRTSSMYDVDGRGHADVALRRFREEPAVLEDLVEQLRGLALAAQVGRAPTRSTARSTRSASGRRRPTRARRRGRPWRGTWRGR